MTQYSYDHRVASEHYTTLLSKVVHVVDSIEETVKKGGRQEIR